MCKQVIISSLSDTLKKNESNELGVKISPDLDNGLVKTENGLKLPLNVPAPPRFS